MTGSTHATSTEWVQDWRDFAVCRGMDTNTWFPTPGQPAARKAAMRICRECPVRRACLVDAMRMEANSKNTIRHGIRGGLTPGQRAGLAKGQRRKEVPA